MPTAWHTQNCWETNMRWFHYIGLKTKIRKCWHLWKHLPHYSNPPPPGHGKQASHHGHDDGDRHHAQGHAVCVPHAPGYEVRVVGVWLNVVCMVCCVVSVLYVWCVCGFLWVVLCVCGILVFGGIHWVIRTRTTNLLVRIATFLLLANWQILLWT